MQPDVRLEKLILERYSPRSFTDQKVTRESLQLLFEAARWAASCYNEQPWRFVYALQEESEEFARLAGCLTEFNQSWAPRAPVLMLTLASRHFAANGKPNRHAQHDVGLAMGSLTFQAVAMGMRVHEMAGFDPEKAMGELEIPDEYEALTMVAIGYPAPADRLTGILYEKETAPRSRKDLSEIVFHGRFGASAALSR